MLVGYRTYISLIVGILSTIAQLMGVEIDVEGITNSIVTLISLGAAFYFRYKVTTRWM